MTTQKEKGPEIDVTDWLEEHQGLFKFEVMKPKHEPGGQRVGTPSYPFRLTHLPTGIQIIVPPRIQPQRHQAVPVRP